MRQAVYVPSKEQQDIAYEKAKKRYDEAQKQDKAHNKKSPIQKLYGIFRYDEEGHLVGFVENSFSMGWSRERVRVNTKAMVAFNTTPNQPICNGKCYRDTFVVKISSHKEREKYGIVFDRIGWRLDCINSKKTTKFERRNIKFQVVDKVSYQGKRGRGHEQCDDCKLETVEPMQCNGHHPGECNCSQFQPKDDVKVVTLKRKS